MRHLAGHCSHAGRVRLQLRQQQPGRLRARCHAVPCTAAISKDKGTISLLRQALDASTSGRVGQTYEEASTYMRSLGFENATETMRVLDIAMNPNSLYLDRKRSVNTHARKLSVDGDLKPVVECLRANGFSPREIVKVISGCPAVLCYSPSERLQPFFDYLKELGIGTVIVARRPTLLGLEVTSSLQRIVSYLTEVDGKSQEEIAAILDTI